MTVPPIRYSDVSAEGVLGALGLRLGQPDTTGAATRRRQRSWTQLIDDLGSLSEDGFAAMKTIDDEDGHRPSPCPGWSVTDVVTHLALGDQDAIRALRGERWTEAPTDADREINRRVRSQSQVSLQEAMALWQQARTALLRELGQLNPADRYEPVEWAVQPISRLALVQSRAMETWIHGWDCSVGLHRDHLLDDRAFWVADLGVRALPYAINRAGLRPTISLSARLAGPAGGQWRRDAGSGTEPATLDGAGWAWVVLCARRVSADMLRPFLRAAGSASAEAQLYAARAFL